MIWKGFFNLTMEDKIKIFEQTVVYVENQYIPVTLTCKFFGITYRGQIDKIKNNLVLQSEWKKISSEFIFGDKRSRVCLTKKGFIRWIQLLNVQLVTENLRETLSMYQSFIFDYMFGNIQSEDKTKLAYARLNKLKRLQSRIKSEINKSEKEIQTYLCSKFGQLELKLLTPE